MKMLLLAAFAVGVYAQDKITFIVTRSNVTRTAEISGTAIVDALKALDADVAAGSGLNETDALRKAVIAHLLAVLEGVTGTSIQQAAAALAKSQAAYTAARDSFTAGAEATPVR